MADSRISSSELFDPATAPTAWEPVGETPRFGRPRAQVSSDSRLGWLRRVLPLVRARRGTIALALVAGVGALAMQVALPRVAMAAIDDALIDRSSSLNPFIVALLALALVRALLSYWFRLALFRTAYEVEYDLRTLLYDHLTRLSFSFYDRVQSGQVISRANSDIRSVQMFLTFAPLMVLAVVTFFVALVVMLSIDVVLTLVSLAAVPLVYAAGVRLRNVVFPVSWIVQGRVADVATIVDENVAGVRIVRSFAAEGQQVGLLARAARRLRWASVLMVEARARWAPVIENLPRLGLAVVLMVGGIRAIDGHLTVGTIVAFNAYVVLLQGPFRFLGFFLTMGRRAAASAERIFEILDEAPEIVDRPGAIDLIEPTGRIEFREATFGYTGGLPILDRFSLIIEPGESVAIVGATGSGKSTVIRLLDRFYDVDNGAVLVDGHDVRNLTVASLRAAIGLVLDEPFLFSDSVHANIAYGKPLSSRDDVQAAASAAGAADFITALPAGYDTVIGERGYTLSGGQRQRIALARTLLTDPAILVLDDATSAVDVHVEAVIHEALRRLRNRRTTIVIAHRLSTIALAGRVVLLDGGQIVATGTHEELLATEPRYTAVLARTEGDPLSPTFAAAPGGSLASTESADSPGSV